MSKEKEGRTGGRGKREREKEGRERERTYQIHTHTHFDVYFISVNIILGICGLCIGIFRL